MSWDVASTTLNPAANYKNMHQIEPLRAFSNGFNYSSRALEFTQSGKKFLASLNSFFRAMHSHCRFNAVNVNVAFHLVFHLCQYAVFSIA
mmetsp:Transcript_36829/g.66760  ORF Transcript_36829/g.66760 Transcript_36829/m.66760 type:complete len:90 (+) Transcript_36829:107-376(+)